MQICAFTTLNHKKTILTNFPYLLQSYCFLYNDILLLIYYLSDLVCGSSGKVKISQTKEFIARKQIVRLRSAMRFSCSPEQSHKYLLKRDRAVIVKFYDYDFQKFHSNAGIDQADELLCLRHGFCVLSPSGKSTFDVFTPLASTANRGQACPL